MTHAGASAQASRPAGPQASRPAGQQRVEPAQATKVAPQRASSRPAPHETGESGGVGARHGIIGPVQAVRSAHVMQAMQRRLEPEMARTQRRRRSPNFPRQAPRDRGHVRQAGIISETPTRAAKTVGRHDVAGPQTKSGAIRGMGRGHGSHEVGAAHAAGAGQASAGRESPLAMLSANFGESAWAMRSARVLRSARAIVSAPAMCSA